MNWTNIAGLPAPLVSAIKNDLYEPVGDISITGLIKPPRMRQLEFRHDAEITEDAADGIWRLIGSIGHAIIERADNDNHLSEERLTMDVLGWKVSGKADLLNPDMLLSDYKFTSVYAVLHEKPEWVAQVNMYAALYRAHGFGVKAAQIVAVLRDFSKLRAKREPDLYPQVGVVVQPIELWPAAVQALYLAERVRLHRLALWENDADALPMCTDEERWKKDDVWAVKKKGGKRALPGGLHSTLESAQAFAIIKGLRTVEIEHRPGSYPRCESYCSVKQFCSFGKTLMPQEAEEDDAA